MVGKLLLPVQDLKGTISSTHDFMSVSRRATLIFADAQLLFSRRIREPYMYLSEVRP